MHVEPANNPDTSRCLPPVAAIPTTVLPRNDQTSVLTAPQAPGETLDTIVGPRGYAFVVTCTAATILLITYRQGGVIQVGQAIGTMRYVPQFDIASVTAQSTGVVTAWLEDVTTYRSVCP